MTALSLTLLCKMKVSHSVFQWNFFFFFFLRKLEAVTVNSWPVSRGLKAMLSHNKLIMKYLMGPEEGS